MGRISKIGVTAMSAMSLTLVSVAVMPASEAKVISEPDDTYYNNLTLDVGLRDYASNNLHPHGTIGSVEEVVHVTIELGSEPYSKSAPGTSTVVENCLPDNLSYSHTEEFPSVIQVINNDMPSDARINCQNGETYIKWEEIDKYKGSGYYNYKLNRIDFQTVIKDRFAGSETKQIRTVAYSKNFSRDNLISASNDVTTDLSIRENETDVTIIQKATSNLLQEKSTPESPEYDDTLWDIDYYFDDDIEAGTRNTINISHSSDTEYALSLLDLTWEEGAGSTDDINIYYSTSTGMSSSTANENISNQNSSLLWCDSADLSSGQITGQIVYPTQRAGETCPSGRVGSVLLEYTKDIAQGSKYNINLGVKPIAPAAGSYQPIVSSPHKMGLPRTFTRRSTQSVRFVSSSLEINAISDGNNDGLSDSVQYKGPPNITSILLEGTDAKGNTVRREVNNAGNYHIFDDIMSGEYTVTLGNAADNFIGISDVRYDYGAQLQVNNFNADGVYSFTLDASEDISRNVAYRPVIDPGPAIYSIGDAVWKDINKNGLQDNDEPGAGGVSLSLTGADGAGNPVSSSAISSDKGRYILDDLKWGTYDIEVSLPPGYERFTDQYNSESKSIDSDADANGIIEGITLDNEERPDYKFVDVGLIPLPTATLGDFVWHDVNNNGVQDLGEPGVAGVNLNLTGQDATGTPVSLQTVSGPNGAYSFENIYQGYYKLSVEMPNEFITFAVKGHNVNPDENSDIDENGELEIFIPDAANITNIDIGLSDSTQGPVAGVTVGGIAWDDDNLNGIRDNNEDLTREVRVELKLKDNPGARYLSTFTNNQGEYDFNGVGPGDYNLFFSPPPADVGVYSRFTDKDAGSSDDKDSDVTSEGVIELSVNAVQSTLNNDVGLVAKGATAPVVFSEISGNAVWDDINGNGIFDEGEPVIEGVVINLTGSSGDGENVSLTTKSKDSGGYGFNTLKPGNYILEFVMPDGYVSYSPQNVGSDDTKDSDVDNTGKVSITLTEGLSVSNMGAGFIKEDETPNPTPTPTEPTPTDPTPTPTEPTPVPTDPTEEPTPVPTDPTSEPTPVPTETTSEPTATSSPVTSVATPTKTMVVTPSVKTTTLTPKPSPVVTTTVTEVISEKEVRYGDEPGRKTDAEIDTGEIEVSTSLGSVGLSLMLIFAGGAMLVYRRRRA